MRLLFIIVIISIIFWFIKKRNPEFKPEESVVTKFIYILLAFFVSFFLSVIIFGIINFLTETFSINLFLPHFHRSILFLLFSLILTPFMY